MVSLNVAHAVASAISAAASLGLETLPDFLRNVCRKMCRYREVRSLTSIPLDFAQIETTHENLGAVSRVPLWRQSSHKALTSTSCGYTIVDQLLVF